MRRNNRFRHPSARFEVEIEKLVYGGEGLGRHEGKVVFVPFTVPGDSVEVRAIERKKDFIRAAVTRILKPGPGRCLPSCPHFGRCGGCQWQHVDYALQVEAKRRILEEGFHHRFPETRKLLISVKACPNPYGYRSRARVQLRGFGAQAKVGFFRHRSHAVEDVSDCPLFRQPLNEALAAVRSAHCEGRFEPGEKELELACADDGSWAFTQVGPTRSCAGQSSQDVLLKRAGEFSYATTASAFFQANDFILEELITTALRLAAGRNAALDLYSGVGFFSLPLARRYRNVVAVESSPDAHRLCVKNAARARLENIQAICADVLDWMDAVGSIAAPGYELVLLDPPRAGGGVEVMKRLAGWAPENIVYVSCDPQTLIRDLAALPARDYRIDFVEGLDLFPQTYHIETIVRLKRR
jgi:23S rRNA (uracil1939-C5)-methyltransferase